jgi:O-antigen/teichoic acid export membrane protein
MFQRLNYFVLGLLGASVISAITVPFLAWFYSPESIGRFSFFLLTVNFAVQIGTLGLEQGYVREYHSAEDRFKLLLETVFPSLILMFFLFVLGNVFSMFDELAGFVVAEPVVLLGLLIFLAYAFAIAHRFLTVSYRVRSLGAQFCFALVSVKIVFLLGAYFSHLLHFQESFSLYGSYLISMAVPLGVICLALIVRFRKAPAVRGARRSGFGFLNFELLRYSFPLLFGALAFWGVKFSGHIGLRYYESFEELAFYSVGVSVAAGLGIFSSIFNTMWFPFLFKAESAGQSRQALRIGLELTLALLILGSGAAGLVAAFIVHLLPETFSGVKFFLPVLVCSTLLYTLSEVTGAGIALSRQTRFGLYAGVAGSVIAILAALLLCDQFGAVGATYAYGLGHLIFFICRTEFGRKLWGGERTALVYLTVLICVLYVGLCSLSEMWDGNLPVVLGVSLMVVAIPILAKSGYQLQVLRNERR